MAPISLRNCSQDELSIPQMSSGPISACVTSGVLNSEEKSPPWEFSSRRRVSTPVANPSRLFPYSWLRISLVCVVSVRTYREACLFMSLCKYCRHSPIFFLRLWLAPARESTRPSMTPLQAGSSYLLWRLCSKPWVPQSRWKGMPALLARLFNRHCRLSWSRRPMPSAYQLTTLTLRTPASDRGVGQ